MGKFKYDLGERTAKFGESIINFCKGMARDTLSTPLIVQLLRAGTSVGANYTEANGASSRRDFNNKIFICKKEAQESKYWLRMITQYFPATKEQAEILSKEAQELSMIFHKINQTTIQNSVRLKISK